MIQTGNFQFMRNLNEQIVLNLIRKHNIISSSELVNTTGLRPSTIFNILKELSAKSLVVNVGKGDSTEKGGKKPYLWKLDTTSAYFVGLDIEITQISSVILNIEGEVLAKTVLPHERIQNVEELVGIVKSNVAGVLEKSGIDISKVFGIGMAVPGIVNVQAGIIFRTDIVFDENIPITEELQKHYNIPVYIENNANCAAIGAKWAGAGKSFKNFIVALVEFDKGMGGLGFGVMIDEHIYRGSNQAAGELNIPIMELGQMLIFFRHELKNSSILSSFDTRPDELSVEHLVDAALQGDEIAIRLFERIGNHIGGIISKSIALLNPEALIVAGTVTELGEIITEPMKKTIVKDNIPFITDKLTVTTSLFGPISVAVGAACLSLSDFFYIPLVKKQPIHENGNS